MLLQKKQLLTALASGSSDAAPPPDGEARRLDLFALPDELLLLSDFFSFFAALVSAKTWRLRIRLGSCWYHVPCCSERCWARLAKNPSMGAHTLHLALK